MAQKPVRYQCNQPRSVRAENLAPEVVTLSPFCSHLTLCFLKWWTLHHFLCRFENTSQGYWRRYKCHLPQSAFRIDVFAADIQIPEMHLLLQALLPFPAPPPERPGELTRRLIQVYKWVFNSCTTQSGMFVPMASCCYLIISFKVARLDFVGGIPPKFEH